MTSGIGAGPWFLQWRQGGAEERVALEDVLTIGRSPVCDIVLDDPYVSRLHCTLRLDGGAVVLDASQARNPLRVDGKETATERITRGPVTFEVGKTVFQLVTLAAGGSETTLTMTRHTALALRHSTRELMERDGAVVAQFPASEFAAFAAITKRFPDAASHLEVGRAVWGEMGYDQYQIHRLMQRIRQRLGPLAEFLENVRGEGYRFHLPVEHL